MEPFNAQYIQECLSRNDYLSAAAYYKQFHFSDRTKQTQLNQYVAQLERYGGIANAIMSQQTDDDIKYKIAYSMQRKYGQYTMQDKDGQRKNPYAEKVNGYIDRAGNDGNKKAVYFDYEFDNEDAYIKFSNTVGIKFGTKDNNNPTNPYRYTNNGKPVVRVYKSSFKDSGFFDAISQGLNELRQESVVMSSPSVFAPYVITTPEVYSTKSYDRDGNLIKEQRGMDSNHGIAYDYVRDAENTQLEALNKAYDRNIPSELMVSGFMCDAQRQITERGMRGQLSESAANFQLKQINDYYNNQLKSISLTNYDVFATEINGETQNLNPITDSNQKSSFTAMIRAAAKEGRLTCVAGSSGGRVGSVLTIAADLDTEGKSKGNFSGDIQIFVPGLFEEDARNLINQDVNAKILVDKAEHIAFQHAYDLVEGGRLENFDNEGAMYRDDIGEYFVPAEELDYRMLRNEMLKGAIQTLQDGIYELPNSTDEEIEESATAYASKIYYYLNNITTQEDMDKEETKQGIANIVQLLMSSIVKPNTK